MALRDTSKANGRQGRRSQAARMALATAAALAVSAIHGGQAWAKGQIKVEKVQGSATVRERGNTTFIRAADRTIIDYSLFNVPKGSSVKFIQPSRSASVLNRINSKEPSRIDGRMSANGTVYFVNPAGVIFGPDSIINVAALYAAGGNISDADFRAGENRFTASGRVVNQGRIAAANVAMVGNQVINTGAIVGGENVVAVASGGEVYLTQQGGNILVKVSEPAAGPIAAPGGAAVENSGAIAAGGAVQMIGAGDMFSVALRNSGVVRSPQITMDAGRGLAQVGGRIDASGRGEQKPAGSVAVLGGDIEVRGAQIDASGSFGGGQVNIGGSFQGKGPLPNAENVTVDARTRISADAQARGDGGNVVVWSDGKTDFAGRISARGGSAGGNGGSAEVSGKELSYTGQADLRAPRGQTGTLLLDPDAVIIDTTDIGGEPKHIAASTLVTQLDSANVTVQANVSVTVDEPVDASANANANNLTIDAPTINLNDPITLKAGASLLGAAGNATVNVGASGRIQNGIDVAASGATVNVAAGTYAEELNIAKTLTLNGANAGVAGNAARGPESVIITTNNGITAAADGVTIDGFTIRDNAVGAGITLSPAFSGYTVQNNIITNNVFGLNLGSDGTTLTKVVKNKFDSNNNTPGGGASGDAIYTDTGARKVLIDDNTFTGHDTAAMVFAGLLGTQDDITVSNNTFTLDNSVVFVNATNVAITGNTFDQSQGSAIYLGGGNATVTIQHNDIKDGVSNGIKIVDGEFGNFGVNTAVSIANNFIDGNDVGILVAAGGIGAPMTITSNHIANNTTFGVKNDSGQVVTATGQWWGSVNGPAHASNTYNLGSQGNAVSDDVIFVPWLNGGGSSTASPGFTPTGAAFAPVTLGAGSFASIQAAINAAVDGDTINLAGGTYTETLSNAADITLAFGGDAILAATAGTLSLGDHLTLTSTGSLTINDDVNAGTFDLVVDTLTTSGGAVNINGKITGAAGSTVTIKGAGAVTLAAAVDPPDTLDISSNDDVVISAAQQANDLINVAAGLDGTGSVQITVGGSLEVLNVGSDITIAAGATAGNVTLGGGNVTAIDQVAMTAAGGSINRTTGDVIGAGVALSAKSGIGDTGAISLQAAAISAVTTDGNIAINNSLATAVAVSNLATGTGNISFSQSGGGDVTFTAATATTGSVTVDVAGANLSVAGISAGGVAGVVTLSAPAGFVRSATVDGTADASGATVTITATTVGQNAANPLEVNATTLNAGASGDIFVLDTAGGVTAGLVNSTGGNVNLKALNGSMTSDDDPAEDVVGATITLEVTGAGSTIGVSGASPLLVNATTLNAVTNKAAGDSVFVRDTSGGVQIGLVDAGAGDVVLTASAGSVRSAAVNGTADVIGATVTLAGTSLGLNAANPLEINATTLNAATSGDIFIADTAGGLAVSLVNSATGNVNLTAINGNLTSAVVDGTPDINGAVVSLAVTGAASTIGLNAANPLEVNATTVNISTDGGAAWVGNATGITLGPINVGAGINVDVSNPLGPLSTGGTITAAGGSITLFANGLLTLGHNLSSGGGAISLTGTGVTQSAGTVDAGAGTILIDGNDGAIDLGAGTLTTTNATAAAIRIIDGTTAVLGTTTAAAGRVVLGEAGVNNLSGAVTQNGGTAITASELAIEGGGAVTLGNANAITTLLGVTRGGAFTLADGGGLTVTGPITGGTTSNPVDIATTGGALTINGAVTGNGVSLAGDGISLGAMVNAGAGTLVLTAGANPITQTVELAGGTLNVVSASTVTLNDPDNAVGTLSAVSAGVFVFTNSTGFASNGVDSGGNNITLTAGGTIAQGGGVINAGAATVELITTAGDVGSAATSLRTTSGTLDVDAVAGGIYVHDTGSPNLLVGNTVSDDLRVAADGTLTLPAHGITSTAGFIDLSSLGGPLATAGDLGTNNQPITLTAGGGLLTAGHNLNSNGGAITLNGIGVTQSVGTANAGAGAILVDGGSGAVDLSAGTLTGNGGITIRDATAVVLGQTNTTGTLILGTAGQQITGDVSQGAGDLAVGTVAADTTGAIDLSVATNQIAVLGTISRGGALTVRDSSGGLTVGGAITGGAIGNPVDIQTSGLLTVNGSISTSGANNITLVGLGYTQSAAAAVNAGAGQILIDGNGGNVRTGPLTTTSASATAVKIIATSALDIDGAITAGSGGVVLGEGAATDRVVGALNQSAGITADSLTIAAANIVKLDETTNDVNSITGVSAGAFEFTDANGFTADAINSGNSTIVLIGGGNIVLGTGAVDAGSATVSITANNGSITGGAADAVADVIGGTVNLNVSGEGNTIGVDELTPLEINATTLNGSTGKAAGDNMFILDTAGGVAVGLLDAGAGDIWLKAANGSVTSAAGDAGTADIVAGTLDVHVTGAGNTIGTAGLPLEINAATLNASTDKTVGANVFVTDTAGGLQIGLVDAGAANVTLTATGGAIESEAGDPGTADIVGATVTLTAASIGTSPANRLEINAETLSGNATSGSAFVQDMSGGLALALLSATADIDLLVTNGSLTSLAGDPNVSDLTGNTVTLEVTGATSTIGQSTAAPLEINAQTLSARTAGVAGADIFIVDLASGVRVGSVNAGAGNVWLKISGGALESATVDGTADIVGSEITLLGSGTLDKLGTSAIAPLEIDASTLSATAGVGASAFLRNTSGDLTVKSVTATSGDVFLQVVNGTVKSLDSTGAAEVTGSNVTLDVSGAGKTIGESESKPLQVSAVQIDARTSGGANDHIFIQETAAGFKAGAIDAGGGDVFLTAIGGSITEDGTAGTRIVGDRVVLKVDATMGVGTSAAPVGTNARTLEITTGTGGAFVAEQNGVTITSIVSTGDVRVAAATGDMKVKSIIATDKAVTLTAGGGSILTENNGGSANVSAKTGNFTAATGIDLLTAIESLTAKVTGAGTLKVVDDNALTVTSAEANGGVTIETRSGDLTIKDVLAAGGTAGLTATAGSVLDDGSDGTVIEAATVNLTSGGAGALGQSGDNDLDLKAGTVVASAGSGGAFLHAKSGGDFTVTSGGGITLTNDAATLRIAGASSASNGNIAISSTEHIAIAAPLEAKGSTANIIIEGNKTVTVSAPIKAGKGPAADPNKGLAVAIRSKQGTTVTAGGDITTAGGAVEFGAASGWGGNLATSGDVKTAGGNVMFRRPVTLTGKVAVNAGNGVLTVADEINGTGDLVASARSMTLRNLDVTGNVTLKSAASTDDKDRPLIVFEKPAGDDSITLRATAGLFLNTDASGSAVHATVPGKVTMLAKAPLVVETGTFAMGRNEKLSSTGDLTIRGTGGSAAIATLGDVNSGGTLTVNANSIRIQPRAGGNATTASGSVADSGVDIAAARAIVFSTAPIMLGGDGAPARFGVNPGGAFDPNLSGFDAFELSSAITPESLGAGFDAVVEGQTVAVVPVVAPHQAPQVQPTQGVSSNVASELEKLGIFVKKLELAQFLAYLEGVVLYNDVPSNYPTGAELPPQEYKVTQNRLVAGEVAAVLDAYYRLFYEEQRDDKGEVVRKEKGDQIRVAIDKAAASYLAKTGKDQVDPVAFRAYVDSSEDQVEARQYLNSLKDLFDRILPARDDGSRKGIGLTRREAALSRRAIVESLGVVGMPPEDLEAAILAGPGAAAR